MAFELAGARLLMPDFGMGIDVWAAVIATTLGLLAVGYWLGGRLADARPSVITLAVVLLMAGASLATVRLVGRSVPELFGGMSLVAAAWCSAALLLAGPLLLLGAVPPILARLMIRATEQAGSVVGGLMAAGTIGGVLGTVLTALVLIPRVGVSGTLLILACGTAAMAVVALAGARSWKAAGCATLAAAALGGVGWQPEPAPKPLGPMRVLERVEGLYGYLEVVEYKGTRAVVCNGVFQTAIPVSGFGVVPGTLLRGRDYVELIPYFRPQARTALLIGLGGAQHPQALSYYGIHVHSVEIEPAMAPLASEYFGLVGEVTVADGRAFLARDPRRFDVIILDAFLGGTVPEHLYTKEAFEQMSDHIEPNGLLAIHLISRPGHAATRAVTRTVEAVFPQIVAVRSGFGDELQHIYLFASHEILELRPEDRLELDRHGLIGDEFFSIQTAGAPLLTDDRSSLALLTRDLVAEHRHNSRQLRRSPSW
ncbi:MAG: fused MFS/spermidine synthase [Planctomycetota bacterium]|jgi:SAM-dependent methyltransferase